MSKCVEMYIQERYWVIFHNIRMEGSMAMPIKPTPVLNKEEAVKFLKKVEENLNKPSYRIATPKLAEVKKMAKCHAEMRTK